MSIELVSRGIDKAEEGLALNYSTTMVRKPYLGLSCFLGGIFQ
jgi:hypothetical protein